MAKIRKGSNRSSDQKSAQELKHERNEDYQAYAIMLLAGILFVGGNSLAAENHKLNIGSITFWRGLSTIVFNYLIVKYSGRSTTFAQSHDFWLLNKRSIIFMLQGLLLSLALYYLPPSTVHTINSSSPIVVYVVDYLRNGTQVSQKQVFGILIGFLSIIITVNSNYIMHNLGYQVRIDSEFKYIDASLAIQGAVSLALFLIQIALAYAIVITKEIHTQNAFQICFHFGIMQVIIGSIVNFFYQQHALTVADLVKILIQVSLLLGLSNIGLTVALKMCHKSGNISMMMFLNVVTGYLISIFRYGETPNTVAVVGSISIFISLLLVLIK